MPPAMWEVVLPMLVPRGWAFLDKGEEGVDIEEGAVGEVPLVEVAMEAQEAVETMVAVGVAVEAVRVLVDVGVVT